MFVLTFNLRFYYQRSSIVLYWANKKKYYEAAWAYLSTLGGAYASLGEEEKNFVRKSFYLKKKIYFLIIID